MSHSGPPPEVFRQAVREGMLAVREHAEAPARGRESNTCVLGQFGRDNYEHLVRLREMTNTEAVLPCCRFAVLVLPFYSVDRLLPCCCCLFPTA